MKSTICMALVMGMIMTLIWSSVRAGTTDNYPESTRSVELKITNSMGSEQTRWRELLTNLFLTPKRILSHFSWSTGIQNFTAVDTFKTVHDASQLHHWLTVVGSSKYLEKMISDSGGGSQKDCHQEAHLVGRTAYELFGSTVFADPNGFACHSGFYHGAMEAFIREKGTLSLAKNIDNLCSTFKTSFGNFECLHGVGHGVLAYVDYNLPEAITLCSQLSTGFAQSSCYGGLFMENVVTAQGNGAGRTHETRWVSQDPHFPCNKVSQNDSVQTQCYLMQTSRMLDIFNYDFAKVSKNCLSAKAQVIPTCFQSYGRDAAGNSLREPKRTLELCQKVPDAYFQNCISGALNVIVDFWGDKMTDQPQGLCKLLEKDADKSYCYGVLTGRLRDVFGNNREKISYVCSKVEEKYRGTCSKMAS